MELKEFIPLLKEELKKGLPGLQIQRQMTSSIQMQKRFPEFPGKNATIAGVMILLYEKDETIYTVFIQRPNYDGVHSGQISFPGGKKEPGDKTIIDTAIRETSEETGINIENIEVTGTLTPLFIPVSNTVVTPVVGWYRGIPNFTPQPEEVVFIINANIKKLSDPMIVKTKPMEIREEIFDIKFFDYDNNVIWGATAMILNEFLSVIKRGGFYPPE